MQTQVLKTIENLHRTGSTTVSVKVEQDQEAPLIRWTHVRAVKDGDIFASASYQDIIQRDQILERYKNDLIYIESQEPIQQWRDEKIRELIEHRQGIQCVKFTGPIREAVYLFRGFTVRLYIKEGRNVNTISIKIENEIGYVEKEFRPVTYTTVDYATLWADNILRDQQLRGANRPELAKFLSAME